MDMEVMGFDPGKTDCSSAGWDANYYGLGSNFCPQKD
ncbi:hypothetical protein ROG8370_02688 [Roseovarius gaetbuli]|uniref:Uncharacterized protein n=1 Tax=Roseovarius gaetbuli TaxID=1356575 RepID=A0A1X6ZT16_9RHOB|nr:hypothetical protein ROG8370_02688 [Roseovarius gaetbuli]